MSFFASFVNDEFNIRELTFLIIDNSTSSYEYNDEIYDIAIGFQCAYNAISDSTMYVSSI